MRRPALLLIAFLALLSILASGCIIGSEQHRTLRAGELDFKLGPFTYLEEGKLIGLAVGTQAAHWREDEKFMPLMVGIANKDAPTIKISRESFVLQDENGRRYPLVPLQELLDDYGPMTMDKNFTTFRDIFNSHFPNYDRVASNFYPDRAARATVIDRVEVPRFGSMLDILYFPKPDSGIVGRRFELHLTAVGLQNEIFVKFKVD